eukprot:CAMPEP_0172482406 /NCGR_PEP_ID=MMETSP1066-20121228/8778_1 /TAXON_ID=671091 /ORGANISM="Coscinodiscus wailesii, Strain CCMP2513" /LENGTH=89 /DNA_ID=CAMNT_0013245481 /DNA_START=244 /DNA_END=513 /DNA_ORIENTATION=+
MRTYNSRSYRRRLDHGNGPNIFKKDKYGKKSKSPSKPTSKSKSKPSIPSISLPPTHSDVPIFNYTDVPTALSQLWYWSSAEPTLDLDAS